MQESWSHQWAVLHHMQIGGGGHAPQPEKPRLRTIPAATDTRPMHPNNKNECQDRCLAISC
jgi:hypothetical protein